VVVKMIELYDCEEYRTLSENLTTRSVGLHC
jgi:hypothetical protein